MDYEPIDKQSFLSRTLGPNTYNGFRAFSRFVVPAGLLILGILYALSYYFHIGFISNLLDLLTGTSIIFVLFIVTLLLTLDIQVKDVEERHFTKSKPYKLTVVWGIVLVLLGIAAIYFSNEYRKHYAFECSTFWVDEKAGIYHLNYNNDCEEADEAEHLVEMKGFELEKTNYTLCEWCKDWAEDAEMEYKANEYSNP